MCTVLTGVHLTGRDKHYCGSGSPEQGRRFCLAQLLESEATNPFEYEFSFHLEIRGPCLLAGRSARLIYQHLKATSSSFSASPVWSLFWQVNRAGVDLPVQCWH